MIIDLKDHLIIISV